MQIARRGRDRRRVAAHGRARAGRRPATIKRCPQFLSRRRRNTKSLVPLDIRVKLIEARPWRDLPSPGVVFAFRPARANPARVGRLATPQPAGVSSCQDWAVSTFQRTQCNPSLCHLHESRMADKKKPRLNQSAAARNLHEDNHRFPARAEQPAVLPSPCATGGRGHST